MLKIRLLISVLVALVGLAGVAAAQEVCPEAPNDHVDRVDAEAVIASCLENMPPMKKPFPMKTGIFDVKSAIGQRWRVIEWYERIGDHRPAIDLLTVLIDSLKGTSGSQADGWRIMFTD